MDAIVLPGGIKRILARRQLRRFIKKAEKKGSLDLLAEKALVAELRKTGKVDLSFVGEAHDSRRAFYAVKRFLG